MSNYSPTSCIPFISTVKKRNQVKEHFLQQQVENKPMLITAPFYSQENTVSLESLEQQFRELRLREYREYKRLEKRHERRERRMYRQLMEQQKQLTTLLSLAYSSRHYYQDPLYSENYYDSPIDDYYYNDPY
ncbi:unnamed protein product [Rhizopus stolonifer]